MVSNILQCYLFYKLNFISVNDLIIIICSSMVSSKLQPLDSYSCFSLSKRYRFYTMISLYSDLLGIGEENNSCTSIYSLNSLVLLTIVIPLYRVESLFPEYGWIYLCFSIPLSPDFSIQSEPLRLISKICLRIAVLPALNLL